MFGMASDWRLWIIAVVIGLATATRTVGVALLLPFADHVWKRLNGRTVFSSAEIARSKVGWDSIPTGRDGIPICDTRARCTDTKVANAASPSNAGALTLDSRLRGSDEALVHESRPLNPTPRSLPRLLKYVATTVVLVVISVWGLLGYSAWLGSTFGDPLAFSHNRAHWVARPERPWTEQALALVTLEPLWAAYVPSNYAYWQNLDPGAEAMLSVRSTDPLVFAATVLLVVVGWRQQWLGRGELLVSLGLLGIPWVMHAYPAAMQSQARYTVVVYPAWIVASRLISAGGRPLKVLAITMFASLLAFWSGLFGTWFPVY
jgi:hypothetical protein